MRCYFFYSIRFLLKKKYHPKYLEATDWKEMYQVFNCGRLMKIYVSPEVAEDLVAISKSYNVDAQIIGSVEASGSKKLTINSKYGTFEY